MDIKYARSILLSETKAIQSLSGRINASFKKAIGMLLSCKGRVVVTGMGKTGIIGEKISATLASTGTPSLFLHPAEAYHGDLGRLAKNDIVLLLSNSGETEEVVKLLPAVKKIGAVVIAMTGSAKSTIGKLSDVVLETGKIKEACPWDIVPTASTTAMLALGDALALTVFKHRKFTKEQFALYHPGGELGRRLLKVKEVMRSGKFNPVIKEDRPVKDALVIITQKRAGAVNIVNKSGKLTGIFTDGDLRRHIEKSPDILTHPVKSIMTANPLTTTASSLAVEALRILKEKKIDELPVVDDKKHPVGMLDVQDLLDVGLV
ncbi:MAG: KpsF/GutQ family sugar-phosphate isomerase [Planctomycetes bacterium]|nr:KpsF/GutQ family sugar-phosphate isomerase [Planctomycetota bacterium]